MQVTITSKLSDKVLSTSVGNINPMSTLVVNVDAASAYKVASEFKTLVDAGSVTVSVASEAALLDDLEPASVSTASVADGAVSTAKLAAGALSANAAGRAVVAANFFDSATVTDKFANGTIPTAKLANAAVDGTKLADGSVAASHMANVAVDGTAGLVVIRKAFAAGGGGVADDVEIFAGAAVPFKMLVLDSYCVFTTAIDTKTAQLRDSVGGLGSVFSSAFTSGAAASLQRNTDATGAQVLDVAGGLWLRRSDDGLAGEVVIFAIHTA